MTKILFIVNPASEIIDKSNTETVIQKFARKYNFKWEIYYTEQSDTQNKIRKKIDDIQPGLVVAAGGDGTINHVASILVNSNIELGIIPAGSANGLAYNLGMPADVEQALQTILDCEAKPVDAICLNNNIYFFHLSDIGINARIIKRFEQEGDKGIRGYAKQMLKELYSERTRFAFNLKTPSVNMTFIAEMFTIANARCYGTGAVINPAGRLDDGEFEIVIIRPYPWWSLFYLFRMFLFGKLEKMKYFKLIKTDRAEIDLDTLHDLQVDGEIIKDIRTLRAEAIPSAVMIRY